MKILSSQEVYDNPNGRTLIDLECEYCGNTFQRMKYDIEYAKIKLAEGNLSRGNLSCCSPKCAAISRSRKTLLEINDNIKIIRMEKLDGERATVIYECKCGDEVKQRVQDAKNKTKECDNCLSKNNELEWFNRYQQIKEDAESKNLKLLTTFNQLMEDKKPVKSIKVKCKKNHISNRTIYNSKNECWKCSISGSNSNFYKVEVKDKKPQNRISLANWKKQVYEIFGKKCFICNSESFVQAHHIIPYKNGGDNMTNPLNGMPLCKVCHKEAHRFSGKSYKKYDVYKFLEFIKLKAADKYEKYIVNQDFFKENGFFDGRWCKIWLLFKSSKILGYDKDI